MFLSLYIVLLNELGQIRYSTFYILTSLLTLYAYFMFLFHALVLYSNYVTPQNTLFTSPRL